jgi:alkylation response protein AidB-like acyl-CoA dehydrogenase
MDARERELFEAGLRHATETHTGEALDAALDQLGWRDAHAADPRVAVSLLFEHQGRTTTTSSALDWLLLAALGVDSPTTGVVLPALGRSDPPGDGQSVRGLGSAGLQHHDAAVVVVRPRGEAVSVETKELELRPVGGLDPRLGLVEVEGRGIRTTTQLGATAWTDAVAAGQRAVAHELVGAARTMLQLARDHAVERIQFGRPIASFQAVRHRLADTLVAIEAADAAAQAAWDDPSALSAGLAKACAGRSARLAARHCQQVLGGIGFTTEHPLHLYIRRTLVLDKLLGDARTLTAQLGADLLQSRRLPSLLPL